jgi:ABC-2 type transport system ATP-binding protein
MSNDTANDHITLEAHLLRKAYGTVVAVDDLSFAARAGEVVGLLGPNGAGKTTAIRVLTTILEPSAGSFAIVGLPHTRPAEIRRQIGVLPESAGYPEHQSGMDFLFYHARLFGQSRATARERATSLLSEVGLAERSSSSIGTYSRGMRQRLGIARALINDPAVVFFDEPTLGLDPAGQRDVLRLVEGIARSRGATVMLSTHFLSEVDEICSRVLILNRGRVVAEGTVAEVSRRAAAPRGARFRVPPEAFERAASTLGEVDGISQVQPSGARSDWLAVTLGEEPQSLTAAQVHLSRAVQALTNAGIPILSFELEGARLSDAFLAMTGE